MFRSNENFVPAHKFWTPERRAEFNAHRTSNRYTAHWLPDRFRRIPEGRPTGGLIEKGPHEGFRIHDKWPALTEIKRTCRNGGNSDAKQYLENFGWFTGSFQDGVIFACAIQIRVPRKGRDQGVPHEDQPFAGFTRVRWVEATQHSDWDQICISRKRHDIHDTLRDAIRAADRVAELAAEEAREHDAKDQAEQETIRLQEEISQAKEVIEGCKKELEAMAGCAHDFARGVLVERIQAEETIIRKAEDRIAKLADDPWLAVA